MKTKGNETWELYARQTHLSGRRKCANCGKFATRKNPGIFFNLDLYGDRFDETPEIKLLLCRDCGKEKIFEQIKDLQAALDNLKQRELKSAPAKHSYPREELDEIAKELERILSGEPEDEENLYQREYQLGTAALLAIQKMGFNVTHHLSGRSGSYHTVTIRTQFYKSMHASHKRFGKVVLNILKNRRFNYELDKIGKKPK